MTKAMLGFQIANSNGVNIQGDDGDPTGAASFEIMPPTLALVTIAGLSGYLLQPIFEGDIEAPVILPEASENPFDAASLTDDQLTDCLAVMRKRGYAVAVYGYQELGEGPLQDMKGGYNEAHAKAYMANNRDGIEDAMSSAVWGYCEGDASAAPPVFVRMVVDCPNTPDGDDSSVYCVDSLDDEHQAKFDAALPWIFETDDAQNAFATEAEACTAQRDHRRLNGFDEKTGAMAGHFEAAARAAGWTFDEEANEYRLDHGDDFGRIDSNKTWRELCEFHDIAVTPASV